MKKLKFIIDIYKIISNKRLSSASSLIALIGIWASFKLQDKDSQVGLTQYSIDKLQYLKDSSDGYLNGNTTLINRITENIRKNIINW